MHDPPIQHQAAQQMFSMDFVDGSRAFLKYRFSDDDSGLSLVDFYSTFVPTTQRGNGLAAALVEQGLQWAEDNNLNIKASCWYAAKKLAERI